MTTVAEPAWRCFVAIPLPTDVRDVLQRTVAPWRAELDTARWTEPDDWHTTLHFVGSVAPDRIPALSASLAADFASEATFVTATDGLGAFPSAARATVLVCLLADPLRRLQRLAAIASRAVTSVLGDAGQEHRWFRPHVTLARLRRPTPVAEWLGGRSAPAAPLSVREACLMRSRLGRHPARYDVVARFPLAA